MKGIRVMNRKWYLAVCYLNDDVSVYKFLARDAEEALQVADERYRIGRSKVAQRWLTIELFECDSEPRRV